MVEFLTNEIRQKGKRKKRRLGRTKEKRERKIGRLRSSFAWFSLFLKVGIFLIRTRYLKFFILK